MPSEFNAHRAQIAAILISWKMPRHSAERTAEVMAWADLHGIDSHGISMIPPYDERRRSGRLRMDAEPRIERDTPVSALVDGDGGLGYVPARLAMETAIAKALTIGVGVVPVHNSAHFGACGFYAKMASDAGLIGMVATSAAGKQVAPAGGKQAQLGTDPWAFAAPGEEGRPFLLDMATTTVAAGRIRNKANENVPAPAGWLVDKNGMSSTDPLEASEKGGSLTPLGGTIENSSYKGYGLAGMVNILSACLSGSTLITDPMHLKHPKGQDLGHFFLALRPTLFRDGDEFREDVGAFCASLRQTAPLDPARPVQVAGDPERANAAQRLRDGIPVAPGLLRKVRAVAEASGAPWLLGTK